MTNKEFAVNLASIIRKRAVFVATNGSGSDRDTRLWTAISCAFGAIADDIDKLANSMAEDSKRPPNNEWVTT